MSCYMYLLKLNIGFVFIKYFDFPPILNFWWKYLAVLSLNTDYAWNLLNYF